MMEVNFDIAVSCPAEPGETVEVFGTIFVLRKEKSVLGGASSAVLETSKPLGILLNPSIDFGQGDFPGWAIPFRFVMIADGDKDVHRLA